MVAVWVMGVLIIIGSIALVYAVMRKSSAAKIAEQPAAAAPFILTGPVEMAVAGEAVVVRAGDRFYVIDPARARARVVVAP